MQKIGEVVNSGFSLYLKMIRKLSATVFKSGLKNGAPPETSFVLCLSNSKNRRMKASEGSRSLVLCFL